MQKPASADPMRAFHLAAILKHRESKSAEMI
jgi:hypothetical protein